MPDRTPPTEDGGPALARLYDLDVAVDPGDLDLYLALASRAAGPVMELAVGSGRIAVPLAAAGHDVTGLDLDTAMLDRAAARAATAGPAVASRLHLVRGDLLSPPTALGGSFALVILALNSILLLPDLRAQRRAIEVMARLLRPGGIAVVDAWQPLPEDLARFDGRLSLEWLRRDPETGRDVTKVAAAWYDAARRNVTLTTLFDAAAPGEPTVRHTRTDALHLLAADELAAAVEDAGLSIETLAGDVDLGPLDPGSGRAIVVARRD